MARTAEQILVVKIGKLVLEMAVLQARIDEQDELIAALKAKATPENGSVQ